MLEVWGSFLQHASHRAPLVWARTWSVPWSAGIAYYSLAPVLTERWRAALQVVVRVWDCLLVEGSKVAVRMAMAIIKVRRVPNRRSLRLILLCYMILASLRGLFKLQRMPFVRLAYHVKSHHVSFDV